MISLLFVLMAVSASAVSLELPGRTIHLARPGEVVEVAIRGLGDVAAEGPITLLAKDWLGRETLVPLKIVGQETTMEGIRGRFTPPWLGWMELTVMDHGAKLAGSALRLAVIPEAKSTGEYFRYGLSDHTMTLGGGYRTKALSLIDALGVDIVREEPSWHRVQAGANAPFVFDRDGRGPDQYIDACAAMGVEVQAILNYGVRWATTGDASSSNSADWNRVMPQMDPWLEYVRTTVNHYKDRIRYWEIWNEPDIGFWRSTTAQYVELFDRTSAEIARIQPEARIMNGGFAMVTRQPNPDFVEEFVAKANPAHWHLRAWHDYNTFGELIARHKKHEALYRDHAAPAVAGLPGWMNEGGFHTVDIANEAAQARTIVKKVSTAPALGLGAYFVYTTRDSSRDRKNGPVAAFYGMADYDCSPKPAYAAYNRLIAETAHRRYTSPGKAEDTQEGLWQHLFVDPASEGPHVLVLWREGVGLQSPIWLHWPAASVIDAVDLMGNPVNLARLGNGVVLNLGNDPVYVHLRGKPAYPETKTVLTLPGLLSLVPGGEPSLLGLQLANPTDTPLTVEIRISSDNPVLDLGDAPAPVTLASGEAQSINLPVSIPADASGLSRGQLSVILTTTNLREAITATMPYEVANILSPAKPAGFELTKRTDIHNLHEGLANPAMEWKGAEDLSATGAWEASPEGLRLKVAVTDQKHYQPNARAALWQADSLQFAFRASDNQGDYLELVLALDKNGRSQGWVLNNPEWTRLGQGDLRKQAVFEVVRSGDVTTYTLELSWRSLGYDGPPGEAWRASFIVNDDDGLGRKQWLQLSPGIGEAKNPQRYPLFIYAP
ncbi:MAG: hypothetical protein WC205_15295 [Opitutaceae bacterium]